MNRAAVTAVLATIFMALPASPIEVSDNPGRRIVWSASRLLQRSDFRGRPPSGGDLSALSSWSIETSNLSCAKDGSFHVSVQAVFLPDRSWVREHPTDALLAHEQAHFDLAELYAQLLRERFKNELPHICHTTGFATAAQRIHDDVLDQAESASERYDSDTDHGRRPGEQRRWWWKISEALGKTSSR